MVKKFKITYWLNSNICVAYVEASSVNDALVVFYMNNRCDDVISIEEVEEDV